MMLLYSKQTPDLSRWHITDDVVMGGKSKSTFIINKTGIAIFSGRVSLENNGGFSSVKYSLGRMDIDAFSNIRIKIKGDLNKYQLRLKTNKQDNHAYAFSFITLDKWQTIDIPLREFYPVYRGRDLQLSKYPGKFLDELGFMIANKKAQDFRLEIKEIGLF